VVAILEVTVEEVFYIKPPVDRVILVGTVQEGTVEAGGCIDGAAVNSVCTPFQSRSSVYTPHSAAIISPASASF
jgi:hypothetical protein